MMSRQVLLHGYEHILKLQNNFDLPKMVDLVLTSFPKIITH